MKAIEINHITKKFGSRTIIRDFSLDIHQGEFVAIVGKSGCGKSTLLNMIGLLETIETGEVKIYNQAIPKINSATATKLRRHTINYLFQSYALISDMTVKDNLLLALEYVKISKKEKLDKIQQVLQKLEIDTLLNDKINTLSGGEQQRVAVARTILQPGDIILADEPTGALDPKLADIAFEFIRELRDTDNKTIVLVTHNIEQAKQADRLIDLNELNEKVS
ncbi:ATP-binding cassette domain-containing protein [Staphylococcus pseudintermedius]|nr:ATP-binding cassette domain-containing protein [Staphylococcus pseudintermedius]